ncbi:MAG TPA: tyrosine-type recombinase/integrase [Pseudonocardiaceae bacterium]|nr:tyrosine-type recombinase/integrase [Pseudonocardiaceae bacterium]
MGTRDNGKPDRRTVKRRTEGECIEAVQKLEAERASGLVRKAGRVWTVEQWLTHWVENIAPLSVRYKALVGYRTAVYRHLIPGLGAHKLTKVEPEHFEKLYIKMGRAGLKPATAHQVHRTARTAFGEAYKRGRIVRNPVALAKAPRVEEDEIEPFDTSEIQKILAAALRRRNGVRYVMALALGGRQGEALGFKWERLNRTTKVLAVRMALQRQTWRHGCADPHTCGAKYHKVKPCKQGCNRHTRTCPPPCPADCVSHARWCPQRHGGGLVEVPVKSRAGQRTWVLPDELFDLLLRHEKVQQREREHAGDQWHEGGWMFTQPNGRPIDPRRDLDEWKSILAEADVRDARLHDARDTAATVLLLLGVDSRVVMAVMGWSAESMRKRYLHVTDALRLDVAKQLNTYFWDQGGAPSTP